MSVLQTGSGGVAINSGQYVGTGIAQVIDVKLTPKAILVTELDDTASPTGNFHFWNRSIPSAVFTTNGSMNNAIPTIAGTLITVDLTLNTVDYQFYWTVWG